MEQALHLHQLFSQPLRLGFAFSLECMILIAFVGVDNQVFLADDGSPQAVSQPNSWRDCAEEQNGTEFARYEGSGVQLLERIETAGSGHQS